MTFNLICQSQKKIGSHPPPKEKMEIGLKRRYFLALGALMLVDSVYVPDLNRSETYPPSRCKITHFS